MSFNNSNTVFSSWRRIFFQSGRSAFKTKTKCLRKSPRLLITRISIWVTCLSKRFTNGSSGFNSSKTFSTSFCSVECSKRGIPEAVLDNKFVRGVRGRLRSCCKTRPIRPEAVMSKIIFYIRFTNIKKGSIFEKLFSRTFQKLSYELVGIPDKRLYFEKNIYI